MTKLLTAILGFLLMCTSVHAQLYKWINPRPTSYTGNKIVFSSPTNGFLLSGVNQINGGSQLSKTTNQGASWETVRTFNGVICFDLKDSTGILAGYSGTLFVSTNNATNWQRVYSGISDGFRLADIVSRDTIFLASATKVYRSVNRGQTWQALNTPSNIQIQSIEFVNSNVGFIGKSTTSILKTTDGGQTWQETATTNNSGLSFLSIKFLNTSTGYASREFNTILKTTNGGTTWTTTGANITTGIYSMSFPNDTIGYLVGDNGAMYRTRNAGATWTFISPLAGLIFNMQLYSVYFISADTGFAVGYRGRILKTVDGGNSWQSPSFSYYDVASIAFPDAGKGYALTNGNLYKTADTAKTWNPVSLNTTNIFEDMLFYSRDTGFLAGGGASRVYKTTNGGQTWNVVNPLNSVYGYNHVTGISPINDTTVFMSLSFDNAYALFKSKDRGDTWRKIDSARTSSESFRHIHFLDEKTGYHSRYSQLYKTNDSAKTWALLYNNGSYEIKAIWFIDARTGFVADDYGLKRTGDSGRTWTAIPLSYSESSVLTLKFINNKLGYFTNTAGTIYQTVDTGKTWQAYSTTPNASKYITFTKDSLAYFAGTYGMIISTQVDTGFGVSSVCLGSPITFTSDISGPTYQWQINTGYGGYTDITNDAYYSGATTKTLTINNAQFYWSGFKYRCLVGGTNYSQERTLQYQTQWTGAIDSDWEKPGNWSCNRTPDNYTDVIIKSGQVVVSSYVAVHSLKISPGASVVVTAGNILSVVQ